MADYEDDWGDAAARNGVRGSGNKEKDRCTEEGEVIEQLRVGHSASIKLVKRAKEKLDFFTFSNDRTPC